MDTFTDTGALDSRLGAPAKAFAGRRNRLLIDGKLVDAASGKTFPDYNPATGTILAQRRSRRGGCRSCRQGGPTRLR